MFPGLCVLALGMAAGWLGLWALSGALTHSALFTTAVLTEHPTTALIYARALDVARTVLPNLAEAPSTDPPGHVAFTGPTWCLALLFIWLGGLYLLALGALQRGAARGRWALPLVLVATGAFMLTLVWLPGLFSQDVFSYVAYGRLSATYNLNPYVWPPSALSKDLTLPWIAPLWRGYPAPYGPVWLDVQWAMTRLFGTLSVADQGLAYRALAGALAAANLGLLWLLLRRRTGLTHEQRVVALTALAWNPLVLFELAGNAHNDALMVTLSLLALLLVDRSRSGVLPTVGLTLGALVKYLSGVGVIWVGLAAAARAATLTGRLVRLWAVGMVCALVVVAMALPWLELPDSLDPLLAETASVGYVNSLPDTFAIAVSDRLFGAPVLEPGKPPVPSPALGAREVTRAIERVASLAIFGTYLLWEMRRVIAAPVGSVVAAATARSCLVYILLVSTSVQPWYFCLPVAVALTLGWRSTLARVAVGYSLLALPAIYISYYLRASTPLAVFVAYALLPLLPVVPRLAARRTRRDRGAAPTDFPAASASASTSPSPAGSAPNRSVAGG